MPRTYNGALALDIDDTALALISDPAQIKDGDLFIWLLKWAQENNYYIYFNTSRGISLDNDPTSNGKVSTFQLRKFLKENYSIHISDEQVYLGGVNLADLKISMQKELQDTLSEDKDDIGSNLATQSVANLHHKNLQREIVEANPNTPTKIIVNRKIATEITNKITVLDDSAGEIQFAREAGFDAVHFDLENPDITMRDDNKNVDLRRPHLDLLAKKLGLFKYIEDCYGNPKALGYSEKLDNICREFMAARARRAKGICPTPIIPVAVKSSENIIEQNPSQKVLPAYSPSLIEHIKKTTQKGSFIRDVFILDLLQLNSHSPFYIKDRENKKYILDKEKVRKELENKGNTGLGSSITNLVVKKNLEIIFADKKDDLTPYEIDQKILAYMILIGLYETGSETIRNNTHKAALIRAIKAADESLPADVRSEEYQILADYYYDHKDYKNAATLYIKAYKTATKYNPLITSNTFKNDLIKTWNIAIEKFPFLGAQALQWLKEIEKDLTAQDPLTLWRCQLLANAKHESAAQDMILVALQIATGKTDIKGNDEEKISKYCQYLADFNEENNPELAELWYHAALFSKFPIDYNNLVKLADKYSRINSTADDKALARMIYLYVYTQIRDIDNTDESFVILRDNVLNGLAELTYKPIALVDTEFNLRMQIQDLNPDDNFASADNRIYQVFIPNILAVNLRNPSPYYDYHQNIGEVVVDYNALRQTIFTFLPIQGLPEIISIHLQSLAQLNLIPAHRCAVYNELITYFQYGAEQTTPKIAKNKAFELIFRALKAADQSLIITERLRELRIMSDIYSENDKPTQALQCAEIAKKMMPNDDSLKEHWQYLKEINNISTIVPDILSVYYNDINEIDDCFYNVNPVARKNDHLREAIHTMLHRDQQNPIVSREVDRIFNTANDKAIRLNAYDKLIEYFHPDTSQPRDAGALGLNKNKTTVLIFRALKASDLDLPSETRLQELKLIADYYFEHGDFEHAADYYTYIYSQTSPTSRLKQIEFLLNLPLNKAKTDPGSQQLIFNLAKRFNEGSLFDLSKCLTSILTERVEVESSETLIYFLDMLFDDYNDKSSICQKFIGYYSRDIMLLIYEDHVSNTTSIVNKWKTLQENIDNESFYFNTLLNIAFIYASASFKDAKFIAKELLERILSHSKYLPNSNDFNHDAYLAKAKLLLAYLYLQGDDGIEINIEKSVDLLHQVYSSNTEYSTLAINLLTTLYGTPSDKFNYPAILDLAILERLDPVLASDNTLEAELAAAKNHGDDVSHRVAIDKARAQARSFLADKNIDLGIQLSYFIRFGGSIIADENGNSSFMPVHGVITQTKHAITVFLNARNLSYNDRVVRSCVEVMQSLAYINQGSKKLHEENEDLTLTATAYKQLSENPDNRNALHFIEKQRTQREQDKQTSEIIVNPALADRQPNIYVYILKQLKLSLRMLLEAAEKKYQSVSDVDKKPQARINRNKTIESELDSYDISLFQLIQSYYLSINAEVFISHEEKREKNPWHPENADLIARHKQEVDMFRDEFEKELKVLAEQHTRNVYDTYAIKLFQVTHPVEEYGNQSRTVNLFEHQESQADITRIISLFNLDSRFNSNKKLYELCIANVNDYDTRQIFQNEIIQAVTQNNFKFNKRFSKNNDVKALKNKITEYKHLQTQDLSRANNRAACDKIFLEICEICLRPSVVKVYLQSKQNKNEPPSLNTLKAYAILNPDKISLLLWNSERVDDLHVLKAPPSVYGEGRTHIHLAVKTDGSYLLLTNDAIHSKQYKDVNNINFANDGAIPPDVHEKMIHEREQLYYIYQHRLKFLIHKHTLEKVSALEIRIAEINAQRTITRDDIKELVLLLNRQITELEEFRTTNLLNSTYGVYEGDEEQAPVNISAAVSGIILQLKDKLSDLKVLWDQQTHDHVGNENLWRNINNNDSSDSDDDFFDNETPPRYVSSEDELDDIARILRNVDSQGLPVSSSRAPSNYSVVSSNADETTELLSNASMPYSVIRKEAQLQNERLDFYQQALKALANPKNSKENLPKETRKKLKALHKEVEKHNSDKDLQEKWRRYFEFGESFEISVDGKKYQIGAFVLTTGMNAAGFVAYLTKLALPLPFIRLITLVVSLTIRGVAGVILLPTLLILSGVISYALAQGISAAESLDGLLDVLLLTPEQKESLLQLIAGTLGPEAENGFGYYFKAIEQTVVNVNNLFSNQIKMLETDENHHDYLVGIVCVLVFLTAILGNVGLYKLIKFITMLPADIAEVLQDLITYYAPPGGPALVLPIGNGLTDLFGSTPKREGPTYKRNDREQFVNALQEIKDHERENDAALLRSAPPVEDTADLVIFANDSERKDKALLSDDDQGYSLLDPSLFTNEPRKKDNGISAETNDKLEEPEDDIDQQVTISSPPTTAATSSSAIAAEPADLTNVDEHIDPNLLDAAKRIADALKKLFDKLQNPKPSSSMSASTFDIHSMGHGGEPTPTDEFEMSSVPASAMALAQRIIDVLNVDQDTLPKKLANAVTNGQLYKTAMAREIEKEFRAHSDSENLLPGQETQIARELRRLYPRETLSAGIASATTSSAFFAASPSSDVEFSTSHDQSLADAANAIAQAIKQLLERISNADLAKINAIDDQMITNALGELPANSRILELAQQLNIDSVSADVLVSGLYLFLEKDAPTSSLQSSAMAIAQAILAALQSNKQNLHPVLAEVNNNSFFTNLIANVIMLHPDATSLISRLGNPTKEVVNALKKLFVVEKTSSRDLATTTAAIGEITVQSEHAKVMTALREGGFFNFNRKLVHGSNIRDAVRAARSDENYVRKDQVPKFK